MGSPGAGRGRHMKEEGTSPTADERSARIEERRLEHEERREERRLQFEEEREARRLDLEEKREARRLDLEERREVVNDHRAWALCAVLLVGVFLWRLPNLIEALTDDNATLAATTSDQSRITADEAATVVEILETVATAPEGSRSSILGSLIDVLGSDLPGEVKNGLTDLVQTGGETFARIVEAFRSGSGSSSTPTPPATPQPIRVDVRVTEGCNGQGSDTSDGSSRCEVQCDGSTANNP